MGKLIIVTLLPAVVIFTVFLFNVSVQELIDCRYGLNTNYFKHVASIMLGVYIIYSVPAMIIKESTTVPSSEIFKGMIATLVILLILSLIYFIMKKLFDKKKDEVFKQSVQYEPDKVKAGILKVGSMILIGLSSFTTFILSREIITEAIEVVVKIFKNESLEPGYSRIAFIFLELFLCYILTIMAAGYMYHYGNLFDFKKSRIIYKNLNNKENTLKKKLRKLGMKDQDGILDVYILVDTEESMRIKIEGVKYSSIVVNKKNVENILFTEEEINPKAVETAPWLDVLCKIILVLGIIIGITIGILLKLNIKLNIKLIWFYDAILYSCESIKILIIYLNMGFIISLIIMKVYNFLNCKTSNQKKYLTIISIVSSIIGSVIMCIFVITIIINSINLFILIGFTIGIIMGGGWSKKNMLKKKLN